MPDSRDDTRIPEPVAPLPLPEFAYDDLKRGDRIGTGGDADVYRATIDHNGYTYPVAVKEPRFEGTIQKRVLEKFQAEAETWSRLNDHDNIVSVYGWGTEPLPWLALEFMDGGTLDAQIGSLDVSEALWLSGRIAEGIRYGHRHGVAHLDIKPTNVLLRDTPSGKWDYPKVSDWGLAKMLLEHSNSIEGISPTYAAPEQFDAEEYGTPDDITDIYQLGALVYALLAGEPPFSGSSTAVMQGVLQEDPEPPSAVNSELPGVVDEVVLKALAKQKGDRYEGILPFRKELDRLFAEYIGSDPDVATPGAASAADYPTDQPTERSTDTRKETTRADRAKTVDTERQTQSSSGSRHDGGLSSDSSPRRKTNSDDSSLVSRRAALGLVGVGVLGGGGWMATQMGGNNGDEPAAATEPTETATATEPTETATVTEPERETVIDDFESGSLSSEWRDVFDTSNVGSDGGRSSFTVVSSTAPEGQYALKGDKNQFIEGGSSITRGDFMIEAEGATIKFYAKLGEAYTGNGRPNSVEFRSSADERRGVRISQRLDRAADNVGTIASESLNTAGFVEFRNISFQNQQVGEVAIDSEVVDTNVDFISDEEITRIDRVTVGQGHWRQSHDIVVDGIVVVR